MSKNIIDLLTSTRISIAQANRLPRIKNKTQITEKTHPSAMADNQLAWEQETEKPEGDYILDAPRQVAGVWTQVWTERAYSAEEIAAFKVGAIEMINAHYQGIVDGLSERFPAFERDTWPYQDVEATAWIDNNAAPTPVIDALLAERTGISKAAYCNGFATKFTTYKGIAGKFVGRRQKVVALINNATTKADIDAIVAAL